MSETGVKVRIPQQKRSEETRQKILDAGLALFEEEGYQATSSKKIAKRAGVSIGSFYSYFQDKKHLLMEILACKVEGIEELGQNIIESPELADLDERQLIRMMIEQSQQLIVASPEFNRELLMQCYTDDEVCAYIAQKSERVVRRVVQVLESRKHRLRVTDLDAAAHVVSGAVDYFTNNCNVHFGRSIERERLIDELVDMVHAYLFRPDEPEPVSST